MQVCAVITTRMRTISENGTLQAYTLSKRVSPKRVQRTSIFYLAEISWQCKLCSKYGKIKDLIKTLIKKVLP